MEAKIVAEHLDKIRRSNILRIGETGESIPIKIAELKQTIQNLSPNLKLHSAAYDQDVYLKCLRACDFDVEKSATMYIKYCGVRHSSVPGVRELSLPSLHWENIYKVHEKTLLKARDALGRKIILLRTAKWDCKKVTAEESVVSIMLLFDEALASEDTQRNGIVYIADHSGFSMNHARISSRECMATSIKIFEGSFPIKCEEYHFVNVSMAFNIFLKLFKTFMSEKLRSKIIIHSSLESLHAHVHPSLLPNYLGGMWPDDECVDTEIFSSMLSKDDYYREFLKYGTMNDKD